MRIRLEFKPQDCWIGVFWRSTAKGFWHITDIWLCAIPTLPLHITIRRWKWDGYMDAASQTFADTLLRKDEQP